MEAGMPNPQYDAPPYGTQSEFMGKAVDIAEALSNLTYLISLDSGDRSKVQVYANLAEERLRALGDLFQAAAGEI
jgi:hypothetical protein